MEKIISIILAIIYMIIGLFAPQKKVPDLSLDINVNQLGYRPEDDKIAVLRGENIEDEFNIVDAKTGKTVFAGVLSDCVDNKTADETNRYADFSALKLEGSFYLVNQTLGRSQTFKIDKNVYVDAFNNVVKMFYLQRCGENLTRQYASGFKHAACHTEPATVYETGESIDVSGGWHDAGDFGKYTVAGAKAVMDLMLAYSRTPEKFKDNVGIPESMNGVPDILDEVRYELEWMLKMQRADGGVYHKVTTKDFPGVIMPEDDTNALFVTPVSTTATADFAGTMAFAYEIYKNIDMDFSNRCLNAAELSWSFLEEHEEFIYNNINEITTGDYGDSTDVDERYFAACSLLAATGNIKYAEPVKTLLQTPFYVQLGWQSVAAYGSYLVLMHDNGKLLEESVYKHIYEEFFNQARWISTLCETCGYRISLDEYNYYWGSNMGVANNGMLLLMATDIDPTVNYISKAKAHMDYIFGTNPMGISYVTGTGSVSPENPHHRPSQYLKKAMPGMLVGGPDSNLDDDYVKGVLQNTPPAKCYVDSSESYSTNEITIYWNSPLVFLMSEFV